MSNNVQPRRVRRLVALPNVAPPGNWRLDAACQGTDDEAFFADDRKDKDLTAAAKRVCVACPVRTDCLEYALDKQETDGVWGGLTTRERAQLLRKQGRLRTLRQAAA